VLGTDAVRGNEELFPNNFGEDMFVFQFTGKRVPMTELRGASRYVLRLIFLRGQAGQESHLTQNTE